jgi:signal transduction histidine kinase
MANSIIHDLKNPICIVRCCSDLIANQTSDPKLQQLTTMLNKAVDGMTSMTQELLDYARGSTFLTKESVSIWRLMDELNQQALQLLPGQNVQFVKHLRYEGAIEVDLARFTRLCNLIRMHAKSDARRRISAQTALDHCDEVVLQLADTGRGIPAEILPKLFEPLRHPWQNEWNRLGHGVAKSVIDAWRKDRSRAFSAPGPPVEIRLPAPLGLSRNL